MSAASHWKVQLVAHLASSSRPLPTPLTLVAIAVASAQADCSPRRRSQQANDYNVCRLFYLNFMQIRLLLGLVPARTGARFINTASLRPVLAGGECVIKFNLFHWRSLGNRNPN